MRRDIQGPVAALVHLTINLLITFAGLFFVVVALINHLAVLARPDVELLLGFALIIVSQTRMNGQLLVIQKEEKEE